MTTAPVVAFVNGSTVLSDDGIAALVPALQVQVDRDFAPWWPHAEGATLRFYGGKNASVPPDAWPIAVLDNADQAGALGYHDWSKTGKPMGKVFAKTDIDYGEDWRTTASHELLELLADPHCNLMASATFRGLPSYVLTEVCDPCEEKTYWINGQPVSDFVTPAYFQTEAHHGPATRFDFCQIIGAPMEIAAGGYLSVQSRSVPEGWHQVFGERVPAHKRVAPPRGSRRERRLLHLNHARPWQVSTAV